MEECIKVFVRVRPEEASQTTCVRLQPDRKTLFVDKRVEDTLKESHELTFDHVFDTKSQQSEVFHHVRPIINDALMGFNVTAFAFGMTGSGKTHTISGSNQCPGILPRTFQYVFEELQRRAEENKGSVAMVFVSYFELYNNNLFDLLSTNIVEGSKCLKIHDHPGTGVSVSGSSSIRTPVSSADEALSLIARGDKNRATACTNLNERSSRSHTVVSIEIVTQDGVVEESMNLNGNSGSPNLSDLTSSPSMLASCDSPLPRSKRQTLKSGRVGKINLVDLAGSERVKLSGAEGQTLEEAKQINKALAVLGDVLSSLSKYHSEVNRAVTRSRNNSSEELPMLSVPSVPSTRGQANNSEVKSSSLGSSGMQKPYIPYRNSKLTMLLKDSLGGNGKTMMIATVRSDPLFYMQALTTLRYAARTRNIRCRPVANLFSHAPNGADGAGGYSAMQQTISEVHRLKDQLKQRDAQLKTLKANLSKMAETREAAGSMQDGPSSRELQRQEELYKEQIEDVKTRSMEEQAELEERMKYLINSHNQKVADMQSEREKVLRIKEITESENQELQARVDSAERSNAALKEKVRALQAEITDLKKTLKDVQDAGLSAADREQFIDVVKKLSESRLKHKMRVQELEEKLAKHALDSADREVMMSETMSESVDMKETINRLEADLRSMRDYQARSEETTRIDSDTRQKLQAQIEEMKIEREKNRAAVLAVQQAARESKEEAAGLQADIETTQKAHAASVAALEASKESALALLSEHTARESQSLKERIAALTSSLDVYRRSATDKSNEAQYLNAECAKLQVDLKSLADREDALLKEIGDMKVASAATEEEVERLKGVEKAYQELVELSSGKHFELDSLKAANAEMADFVKALEEEKVSEAGRVEELERTHAGALAEVERQKQSTEDALERSKQLVSKRETQIKELLQTFENIKKDHSEALAASEAAKASEIALIEELLVTEKKSFGSLNESFEEKLNGKIIEISSLEQKLLSMEETKKNLEVTVELQTERESHQKDTIEELLSNVQDAEGQIESLKDSLEKQRASCEAESKRSESSHEKRVGDLVSEVSSLRSDIATREHRYEADKLAAEKLYEAQAAAVREESRKEREANEKEMQSLREQLAILANLRQMPLQGSRVPLEERDTQPRNTESINDEVTSEIMSGGPGQDEPEYTAGEGLTGDRKGAASATDYLLHDSDCTLQENAEVSEEEDEEDGGTSREDGTNQSNGTTTVINENKSIRPLRQPQMSVSVSGSVSAMSSPKAHSKEPSPTRFELNRYWSNMSVMDAEKAVSDCERSLTRADTGDTSCAGVFQTVLSSDTLNKLSNAQYASSAMMLEGRGDQEKGNQVDKVLTQTPSFSPVKRQYAAKVKEMSSEKVKDLEAEVQKMRLLNSDLAVKLRVKDKLLSKEMQISAAHKAELETYRKAQLGKLAEAVTIVRDHVSSKQLHRHSSLSSVLSTPRLRLPCNRSSFDSLRSAGYSPQLSPRSAVRQHVGTPQKKASMFFNSIPIVESNFDENDSAEDDESTKGERRGEGEGEDAELSSSSWDLHSQSRSDNMSNGQSVDITNPLSTEI